MQSLFKPGAKINQDHKHKYIHILAYAASVVETWKKVLSVLRICGPSDRPGASLALVLGGELGCRNSQGWLPSIGNVFTTVHKIPKELRACRNWWHLLHWD